MSINWNMSVNWKLLLFLIVFSPVFIRIALNLNVIAVDWQRVPVNFVSKINGFSDKERLDRVYQLRWANKDSGMAGVYSKFLYNRGTIFLDEFYSFLSFYSPRIYFQAGDGSRLSPINVEPIPIILFPFWIMGILWSVRDKKYKYFSWYLFFGLLAFLFGKMSFSFLWPILVMNLYFCLYGLAKFENKKVLKWYISFLIIYTIYIFLLSQR